MTGSQTRNKVVSANGLRRLGTVLWLAGLVATAPAFAAPAQHTSWGKPGVTLAQYRRDALDCGKQGYYLDISRTEDAKAFVRGSRELDDATQGAATAAPGADPVDTTIMTANQLEQIRRSVNPERRMEHIKALMQATVAQCLVQRGYVQFSLTVEQSRHLSKLARGSAERKTYLYSLASDPAILSWPMHSASPLPDTTAAATPAHEVKTQ